MVTAMFSDATRAAVAVPGDCSREEYASKDFCRQVMLTNHVQL